MRQLAILARLSGLARIMLMSTNFVGMLIERKVKKTSDTGFLKSA